MTPVRRRTVSTNDITAGCINVFSVLVYKHTRLYSIRAFLFFVLLAMVVQSCANYFTVFSVRTGSRGLDKPLSIPDIESFLFNVTGNRSWVNISITVA